MRMADFLTPNDSGRLLLTRHSLFTSAAFIQSERYLTWKHCQSVEEAVQQVS